MPEEYGHNGRAPRQSDADSRPLKTGEENLGPPLPPASAGVTLSAVVLHFVEVLQQYVGGQLRLVIFCRLDQPFQHLINALLNPGRIARRKMRQQQDVLFEHPAEMIRQWIFSDNRIGFAAIVPIALLADTRDRLDDLIEKTRIATLLIALDVKQLYACLGKDNSVFRFG